MHDEIDLLREFTIDFGDHSLDSAENVRRNQLSTVEGLLGQGTNCTLNRFLRLRSFWSELLIKKRLKLVQFSSLGLRHCGGRSRSGGGIFFGHKDEKLKV